MHTDTGISAIRTDFTENSADEFGAKAILAALADAVIAVDETDRIRTVNEAAEVFFGHSAAVLTGKHLSALMPDKHGIIQAIAQARQGQGAVVAYDLSYESPAVSHSGLRICAMPLSRPQMGVVLQIQSPSPSLAPDEETADIDSLAAASVATVLGHEVRNPLLGIRGATQLLERNLAADYHHLLHLIREETDRIDSLIADVDELTADTAIDPQPVNVHEVIRHARDVIQAGHSAAAAVRFEEQFDPSLPPAAGDRNLLIRAVMNLLSNAIEATPARGGEIILTTAWRHEPRYQHRRLPIAVSIADNGPGIDEAARHNLFQPFVSTKSGARGLGLAIVAKIVRDHGGAIEVETATRRTRFTVALPVAAGAGEAG